MAEAAFRAEYEESADVVARRAAAQDHMDSIGTPAMPFPPTAHDTYIKPEPKRPEMTFQEPAFPEPKLPEPVSAAEPADPVFDMV